AARIGRDLSDRVSLRPAAEAMQRQRRFTLALVVCFHFLRHGDHPFRCLPQSGDELAARLELDGRAGEILADRLAPAAQALAEKHFGDRREGAPVLRPAEAVSL